LWRRVLRSPDNKRIPSPVQGLLDRERTPIVTIAAPGPECGGEQFGVWSTETLARPHVPFPDLRITHMPSLLSRMRGLALLYAQEHENGEQAEAEHHQHAEDRRVCQ
jgi:hypothetical protein